MPRACRASVYPLVLIAFTTFYSRWNYFPEWMRETVKVIFAAFDEKSFDYAFGLLCAMRDAGIASEIYPEPAKIKKQLDYVNKRNIPYAILVGDTEVANRILAVKNMRRGSKSPYQKVI